MNVDQHRAEWARRQARQAVKAGVLPVPDACEMCDRTIAELQAEHEAIRISELQYMAAHPDSPEAKDGRTIHPRTVPWLVGHHWRGYDHPLDVWFVCSPCNSALANRHDGALTKEQARAFVAAARHLDRLLG